MLHNPGVGYIAGLAAWCILGALWVMAVYQGLKPRWMHWLHCCLPLAAILAIFILPDSSPWSHALRHWLQFGLSIVAILTLVWLDTLRTRNASVMDVVYTLCISIPAVLFLLMDGRYSARQILLTALVCIWSARLVRHATGTNLGDRGEQQPYVKWREQFAERWWYLSYFQVFGLQGVLIWIFALPVILGISVSGGLSATDVVGLAIWLVGFTFQAGADWQLEKFKAVPENRGKVLQTGLWSLSRHPNYFGETLMYWAYFVFSLAHPIGVFSIFAPIYVTWFMSRGSARPMLDRHMLKTKADYPDYMRRVAGFMPFVHSSYDKAVLERHLARQREREKTASA